MSEEAMAGLLAWVDGMSVDDITAAIESTGVVVRDPATLARYLYARASGAI